MVLVVDTTKPYVKITGVQVKPAVRGLLVEITWEGCRQTRCRSR